MNPPRVPWLLSQILTNRGGPGASRCSTRDLAEEHADRSMQDQRAADRWYRRQALRSVRI